jgi:hypothetical protein
MNATQAIGWALLHFVWQGALVATGLAVVLLVARRQSSTIRYAFSVAALAIMLILPIATALRVQRTALDSPAAGLATSAPESEPSAGARQ